MQALGMDEHETIHVKALVYGKPGTGKTTMGVSAPKPLILLSERQGMTHVRQAAARLGRKPIGVLYMAKIEDYRHVMRSLLAATHNPALRDGPFVVKDEDANVLFTSDEWPETIVIDSLTDVCRLIDAQILLESPPKLGKDGLPVNSERYWQVLKDRCEKFVRALRDIDFHVLFLCLEDDKTIGEGEEAERRVTPALPMRTLPDFVSAAVNVVGVTTRRIKQRRAEDGSESVEADIVYAIRTVGPQWYTLKPYRPLADVEVPDFTTWVQKITGAITTTDAQAASESQALDPRRDSELPPPPTPEPKQQPSRQRRPLRERNNTSTSTET